MIIDEMKNRLRAGLVSVAVLLTGCTSVISGVTAGMADSISSAILNNRDLAMVRDGAPAYLLLMDSLIVRSPDDPQLLDWAAAMNGAYAAAFVGDGDRGMQLAEKALALSERAACAGLKNGCDLRTRDAGEFDAWLDRQRPRDVSLLYGLGRSWASWIQANAGDWAAIAELNRVKSIMTRVTELDETYDYGGAHLYLGVFEALLPAALGGRPETGREHFERAIELSDGNHLLTKVMFARMYARLVYDRDLHDTLLADVLAADPGADGLTLINLVAQEQATELMEEADDYF